MTVLLAFLATALLLASPLAAQQERILHNFLADGNDGNYPYANLIFDSAGNLYGTTTWGASSNWGAVFELTPNANGSWTEKLLHVFNNDGVDGTNPYAGLIFDPGGNLYGTTEHGGTYNYGTVFQLKPTAGGAWTETILHNFNARYGYYPYYSLTLDSAGNLYGTTLNGGPGFGTVFELSPTAGDTWRLQVIHNFATNGIDGYYPESGVIFDSSGNLYGTTYDGGLYNGGIVFELTRAAGGTWTEQVLHSFKNDGTDGYFPSGNLIFDAAGNLFGTTVWGGSYNYGTVFQMKPAAGGIWTEQIVHNFNNNGQDGFYPAAGLIMDAPGNLYGTTIAGGHSQRPYSYGTVFELTPAAGGGWSETILHSFLSNREDGVDPAASLVMDKAGNLYGTTNSGGKPGFGTVFVITP